MAETRDNALEIVRNIVEKLRKEYAPERIILFGSRATGNPVPDSDIDLSIVKETPDRFIDRCFSVRRILSDPDRRVALDIVVLTGREITERLAIGDQFIREILQKGR